jgi:hypothetical protein
MSRSIRLIVVVLAAVIAPVSAVHAGTLTVTGTNPPLNGMGPANTVIEVTFDRAVTLGQFNGDRFRVFGRGTGTKSGSFTLVNANQTVRFTPSAPFSAGEVVYVNLKNDLVAADSSPIRGAGYAFQFTVAALPGAMDFTVINTMSNRTGGPGGPQTRIYGAQATDLNHDGYLDLATVNEVSGDVRVALNTADGSGLYFPFLSPENIGLEASPNEQADFDNDGDTDGCFSATSDAEVNVLKGNGDGTYGSAQTVNLGGAPHGIAVLDVDGDADWDIVDARVDGDDLALMLNDGNGNFGAPSFFDAGVGGEYGLQAADMNNDGIMDLVVGGEGSSEVCTLLGNGNGTFTASTPQDTGGPVWVVVLGDLDGDGNLDAATANSFDATGSILLGNGDGTFDAATDVDSGSHTPSADLGDLDGDGDLDLVLSVFGGGYWRIFANNGMGGFAATQDLDATSNPSCSILVDIDNDGDLDMALTDEIADTIKLLQNDDGPVPPTDCPPSPATCRQPFLPGKAFFMMKDKADPADRVIWKWIVGSSTDKMDFGNPLGSESYRLCVYDGGTLLFDMGANAGAQFWRDTASGYTFKNRNTSSDGTQSILLKAGADRKAKIIVKGKGDNLDMPAVGSLAGPITMQLHQSSGTNCWGATYTSPFLRQDSSILKDRAD